MLVRLNQTIKPSIFHDTLVRMGRFAIILLVLTRLGPTYAQNVAAKDGASLKDTLQWMHNAFPDSRSATEFRLGQTRELNFSSKGDASPACTVTIIDRWKAGGKPAVRETIIDLSLIDPESIKWYVDDTLDKGTGTLVMVSNDDKKNIIEKTEGKEQGKLYLSERVFISFVGPDYAERFAKAFKHAVTLCGGKPSTF